MPVENVVKPAESPTPPANTPPTPLPPVSPASTAAPIGGVKPEPTEPQRPEAVPAEEPKTEAKVVPIEALHEERQKRQALDNQMAQLKAVLGDKFTFDANGNIVQLGVPQQAPQQHNQVLEDVEKAWQDDPKKAVRMEQMLALNWYDSIHYSILDQKEEMASKVSDFAKYERAVDKQLRMLPMEQRAQKGAVEMVYALVKGRQPSNVEELKKQWEAEYKAKLNAADAAQGISGGTFSAPPSSGAAKPTDDQVRAAAAMGMKVEDYMRYV